MSEYKVRIYIQSEKPGVFHIIFFLFWIVKEIIRLGIFALSYFREKVSECVLKGQFRLITDSVAFQDE